MYILNKVSLSDVPISELNMVKLLEGLRHKYDRLKRALHTQRSTSSCWKRESQRDCRRGLLSRDWCGGSDWGPQSISFNMKTRWASGCKGKERVIFLWGLWSSRTLYQGILWIVCFCPGLKPLTKTYQSKIHQVLLNIKALSGAWEEYEQWEAGRSQGGGIALVSDSFSTLLLLVWYQTRQVVGQRQCRWWVIYQA